MFLLNSGVKRGVLDNVSTCFRVGWFPVVRGGVPIGDVISMRYLMCCLIIRGGNGNIANEGPQLAGASGILGTAGEVHEKRR